jgi:hypothetical protein
MRPADTSPEAWQVLLDLVRKMTPAEKLRRAIELTSAVRKAGEAGIRQAHPGADEREVFLRVAQRQLGLDLFREVFGGELKEHGSAKRYA